MKNLKRSIFIVAMVLMTIMLTGCSKVNKLEKALKALNETSYTADANMTMVITTGNTSITQKIDMLMECDLNNMYMIAEIENNKVYTYAKINGQEVLVYLSTDGKDWDQQDTKTLDEFKNENSQIVNADEAANFKYEDGVYVGNVEALNSALTEYMNSALKELETPGISIDSTKVTKYNITLDKKDVSKIEIDMQMSMSGFGQKIDITYTILMSISKVGETKVTIPANL